MAVYDAWLRVRFYDAAERTRVKRYLLREQWDTATDGNLNDVLTAADDAMTAINVLTWSSTPEYFVELQHAGSGVPAIQANNQVQAFTRIYDTDGLKSDIEIPAWDDTVFDEDNQNVVDPAYNTAAAVLALLLRDPSTGTNFALVPQYTQSRTHKSRNIIHD